MLSVLEEIIYGKTKEELKWYFIQHLIIHYRKFKNAAAVF